MPSLNLTVTESIDDASPRPNQRYRGLHDANEPQEHLAAAVSTTCKTRSRSTTHGAVENARPRAQAHATVMTELPDSGSREATGRRTRGR